MKGLGRGMIIAGILLLIGLLILFRPIQMKTHYLTNGERVVVFQEMIHVAGEDFYEGVFLDMDLFDEAGYRILYEGVSSKDEANKTISVAMKLMAESSKLKFQGDYKDRYNKFIRADTSTEVMGKFIDVSKVVSLNLLENDEIKEAINYFPVRSFLKIVVNGGLKGKNGSKNKVILDFRDLVLIRHIEEDPHSNTYIHYGKAHYKFVGKYLKAMGYTEFETRTVKAF